MAITTNDLRTGITLDLNGTLFQVVDFQHVKPGKGQRVRPHHAAQRPQRSRAGAHLPGGRKSRTGTHVKRQMQFLYRDGEDYVFMDTNSYEQLPVSGKTLGTATNYLVEESEAVLQMYGDEIVGVDLPAGVELAITDTDPGVQGDRVSGARKPATLETGLQVQVPLFVNPGDRIQVRHPLG